jgi:hypothetical protein
MNDNDLVQIEGLFLWVSIPGEVVADPLCEGQIYIRSYDMVL